RLVAACRRPAWRTGLVVACAALLALGCVEPELVEEDPAVDDELPDTADPVVVDTGPVRDQIVALTEVLDHTDLLLASVVETTTLAEAHDAGRAALAELVEDEALNPGRQARDLPLLPSESPDRATTPERPALLVTALGTGQDHASALATEFSATLADVIAGDLGSWQRDAEGMIATARAVAQPSAPLDQLESDVLTLPGEGLRATAWIMILVQAPDLDRAVEAAERARAHVGLMRTALEELP
ncbi:MAG: hypothetical protein WD575_01810, partial [Nitriliruptoraceae bacterium]